MSRVPEPAEDRTDLVLEDRFAIVPEWLLDADISDAAVRLYAVLLRYGQTSGARMPARSTLARRLRKRSTDSVDRAMKDLVALGAVRVEHRYDGAQRLTNAYHVRTSRPGVPGPATPTRRGRRRSAATPKDPAEGGRTNSERVAADSGHDPKHLTQRTSTSPAGPRALRVTQPAVEDEVATACGIGDWSGFVAQVQQARRDLGGSVTRWAGPCLATALQLAIRGRGWPPTLAPDALRQVAADPESRSPMRVAEAGPWWDESATPNPVHNRPGADLRAMELALLEAGGIRIELQMQARRELEEAGTRITRNAVVRSAYRLLLERDAASSGANNRGGAA